MALYPRRLQITVAELVREQRIPRRSIMQAIDAGRIRHRKRGHRIELHPDDVEREFGWPPEAQESSPEAQRIVRNLME